jgi:broad specificity phosphatase PhoE
MSVLVLFRHGQASYLHGEYDQLSSLGERQSSLLGQFWADQQVIFDHIYIGPRRRHRQTHDQFAAVYRERSLPWPEPIELQEFDEYPAIRLVQKHLLDDWIRRSSLEGMEKESLNRKLRKSDGFNDAFRELMLTWVRGELQDPEVERWHEFRSRVTRGIEKMTGDYKKGRVIAAFTSAGTVAAAAGKALDVSDEKILEMSWNVRNATFTDFLFTKDRFSLRTFNASPYIHNPELLTYY